MQNAERRGWATSLVFVLRSAFCTLHFLRFSWLRKTPPTIPPVMCLTSRPLNLARRYGAHFLLHRDPRGRPCRFPLITNICRPPGGSGGGAAAAGVRGRAPRRRRARPRAGAGGAGRRARPARQRGEQRGGGAATGGRVGRGGGGRAGAHRRG